MDAKDGNAKDSGKDNNNSKFLVKDKNKASDGDWLVGYTNPYT